MLGFWGKAQPLDPETGPAWHPLPFHSLDVAAVGKMLLTAHSRLGDHIATLPGLPLDETIRLVAYLLSVHDVGKFAAKFQAKVPRLFPACFNEDPARVPTRYDHGDGGLQLFDRCDQSFIPAGAPARARLWRPFLSAVTGHHGAPPSVIRDPDGATLRTDFGEPGIAAALLFVQNMRNLLSPPDLPSPNQERLRRASFAMAGLAVLADWIGSNQHWFPFSLSRSRRSPHTRGSTIRVPRRLSGRRASPTRRESRETA